MSNKPPPGPWKKGRQEGYSCAVLEVLVVEDDNGWLFSQHDFQGPQDAEVAQTMQNGGVRQVAHALLTEALRREVFLCVLAAMSANPDLLSQEKEKVEQLLANGALATIMSVTQKMLPGITKEVLEMVRAQIAGPEKAVSE